MGLCLGGGGITGAMYEVGCLAALEEFFDGFSAADFDVIVGASSGATVATVLAGGFPATRLYRALLDPADDFFPLKRNHLMRLDGSELRRVVTSVVGAARHFERDARLRERALGADDALGHGGLGDEEGAGDLVGGEAADQAQRQRHAGLGRQQRVTGGEDEAQQIVADMIVERRIEDHGRDTGALCFLDGTHQRVAVERREDEAADALTDEAFDRFDLLLPVVFAKRRFLLCGRVAFVLR